MPTEDLQAKAENEAFLAEMEHRRAAASQTPSLASDSAAPIAQYPAASHASAFAVQTTETGIVGFLLKRGVVKNASQANVVLVGVFVLVVGIIAWINWPQSSPTPHSAGVTLPPSSLPASGSSSAAPTP